MGELADYRCPVCGSPVEDFVCTNGDWGDCGYITCPICHDGSGGPRPDGEGAACPHHVASWIDEPGFEEGPLLSEQEPPALPALALSREPTEAEIDTAYGGLAALARSVYGDSGFAEPGDLVPLYEAVCETENAFYLWSSMTGVMAWSFAEIFAADPAVFSMQAVELAARLARGTAALESLARAHPE
jgi:hypothetical protein